MSPILCQLSFVLSKVITVYIGLLLIYAVVSWLPSLRGRWTEYLEMFIEPVLLPMRRAIPPFAGLDISFLVLLLVLQFVRSALVEHSCIVVS